jgi:hypothetical protein
MENCRTGYSSILVKSYPVTEGSHRYQLVVRPMKDQGFPESLLVECNSDLMTKYPAGTVFRICVKLKNTNFEQPHLYSYHAWKYEVIELDEA